MLGELGTMLSLPSDPPTRFKGAAGRAQTGCLGGATAAADGQGGKPGI